MSPAQRGPGHSRSSSRESAARGAGGGQSDEPTPITASFRLLSSSLGSPQGTREPIRSYIHASMRDQLLPVDSNQNARTVREDSAELASYLLSDGSSKRKPSFLQGPRPSIHEIFELERESAELVSPTVQSDSPREEGDGPSVLSSLLRRSPPDPAAFAAPIPVHQRQDEPKPPTFASPRHESRPGLDEAVEEASEDTPLLNESPAEHALSDIADVERQKRPSRAGWLRRMATRSRQIEVRTLHAIGAVANPRRWDRKAILQSTVKTPAACLPAVLVGLLLNVLDALSYGMILFPLGNPMFANLGSAGLSIYYVSTIVSQVVFSSGSVFKGAVGSELIEVVPFFHHMALRIADIVGPEDPEAVVATTMVAYAISSMMTGLVFYLMGRFKFGFMVGFIPRHILIGCIGGVGWFLIATGLEVSARLDGSLEYSLDTLFQLSRGDTVPLWVFPLVLSIALFYGQSRVRSKYFLPLYILAIPLIFYVLVSSISALNIDNMRQNGWIFNGPPPGEPWWYFYTLYKFDLVSWRAVAEVIPAMLALTFFGILHVPINVPALALHCGEDNADLDRELKLHGFSNFLSGCCGSIQNYLVYANTVFFIRSGGDKRLAGYMLAILTAGMMMIGPSLIGFIPVMMVATLIFDLGFELLLEAVWLPRKKLKLPEYLTVIAIVLIMGIYDFVVGIGVGILLAFVSLIIQTSRVPAIRGTYGGDVVTSTVRRNPSQQRYLQQVGQQIYIIKLTGYLFFGTIVSVDEKIRAILDDQAFARKPVKFVILDMWHVSGLDYSAGEAFNTISRLLHGKGVFFVLSGVDDASRLGQSLRTVGVGTKEIEVLMLPSLNSALESCENELLKTLYARQEELNSAKMKPTASLDVPAGPKSPTLSSFEAPFNSPRRSHQAEAAREALTSIEVQRPPKWQSFQELAGDSDGAARGGARVVADIAQVDERAHECDYVAHVGCCRVVNASFMGEGRRSSDRISVYCTFLFPYKASSLCLGVLARHSMSFCVP